MEAPKIVVMITDADSGLLDRFEVSYTEQKWRNRMQQLGTGTAEIAGTLMLANEVRNDIEGLYEVEDIK